MRASTRSSSPPPRRRPPAATKLLFVSLATLLFRLCLAAVFPVAIAASVTAATDEGGHSCRGAGAATHLHRAWRLMTAAASWKEAALQVLVVTVVLPLATYPVYAFALDR
ncbi:hypothetical protein ZWY2020_000855 [Hordeum vulgare]|nr:hypothetical protein ZWY2020_000855 [Hordeum vulgare]